MRPVREIRAERTATGVRWTLTTYRDDGGKTVRIFDNADDAFTARAEEER